MAGETQGRGRGLLWRHGGGLQHYTGTETGEPGVESEISSLQCPLSDVDKKQWPCFAGDLEPDAEGGRLGGARPHIWPSAGSARGGAAISLQPLQCQPTERSELYSEGDSRVPQF